MAKLFWKPGTLLAPAPPTLVSCGNLEHPNVLTVGWTGIVNTQPAMTYVSIRPERYSYDLIKQSGEFVINLTPASLARAADFCGVRSGRDVNKWEVCALTPVSASLISAPLIAQCPVSLECRVQQIIELGSHHMFLSEIVAVAVEDSLVDKSGRLDLSKGNLLAYAHGEYFELGRKIGSFGFSVRKNNPKKHKPTKSMQNKNKKP